MFVGVWSLCARLSVRGHAAWTLRGYVDMAQCLLLSCLWAQHLCQSGQGWTWTNTTPVRFNVGLLVEAGDGGGGAPVPGSCSWTSLFIFLLPRRCGGRQHGGRGFGAADSAMLTAGVVLSGGMCLLGYAPHALPITCGRRAAVEGREGSDRLRSGCISHRPCDGVILGLFCRARTD